jgi:hypothetical protein
MARVQIDIAAERLSDPSNWARVITVALNGDARWDTKKNLIAVCETGWLKQARKVGEFYVDIPLGRHTFGVSISGSPHTLEGQTYTGIWKATVTLLVNSKEIGKIDFEGTRVDQAQVELTIP